MTERDMDDLSRLLREEYNPPPPTPRDEMWAVIQAGMEKEGPPPRALDDVRRAGMRVPAWRQLGWAAAAVAVLGLGIGLGRMTAPTEAPMAAAPVPAEASLVRLAAVEHLGRSESLLRMVRADGLEGRMDPAMGAWSRSLLTQTRLLLDSSSAEDPALRELLEDLELVLVQIAAVSEVGGDEDRVRSELSLALNGLEQRDVLPRIQAVMPNGSRMAGI